MLELLQLQKRMLNKHFTQFFFQRHLWCLSSMNMLLDLCSKNSLEFPQRDACDCGIALITLTSFVGPITDNWGEV